MIVNDANYPIFYFVLFSAIIWILIYVFVCWLDKNVVNILTVSFLVFFPTRYFFEVIYIYNSPSPLDIEGYVYFFSLYTVIELFNVAGYYHAIKNRMIIFRCKSASELILKTSASYDINVIFSCVFSLFALALFLPVILEFKEYILTPRRIYELTRTGYGVSFFGSNVCSLISIIFCFYAYQKYRLISIFIVLINVFLILLHGSKGPILSALFMLMFYLAIVKNIKFRIYYLLVFVLLASSLMFYFFLSTYGISFNQVLLAMSYYSDYTRNAIVLFDSDYPPQLGRLLFESEFYSRVPRFLFPSKPDDFGYLGLAKEIFPDAFYLNQGAPSFGVGTYYADFGGIGTFFVVAILNFFGGILSGIFRNQLNVNARIYFFIPYLFFCGLPLLNLGYGWMFYEHVVLSFMIFLLVYFCSRVLHVRY